MIVMKFGGTSVQDAKAIERAGAIVKGRLEQKPVVVVSAMAKVTDHCWLWRAPPARAIARLR